MAAHDTVERLLLNLRGGDPFADVAASAPSHRDEHGQECGLYPAGPAVMSLAGSFARAAHARTTLDLGCGTGYSSLWLAHSTSTASRLDAVDRFGWHLDLARHNAATHGLGARITFHEADAAGYLATCDTRYDLIHDDAWFAHEPSYLQVMIGRLEPGGVLTMPNWFLLTEAVSDHPSRDWSEFAGSDWRDATLSYAHRLASHPELEVNWITDPPLGVAVRRGR